MLSFYDEEQNPIDPPRIMAHGELFLVGYLWDRGLVGVFIEDDDCYHLRMTFHPHWLSDFERAATAAKMMFPLMKTAGDREG